MTKTIHDAWVALDDGKADKINTEGGSYLFFSEVSDGYFTFDARHHRESYYQYICTTEEFNNYKGDNMKTIMDAVNELKGEWPDFTGLLFGDSKARIGYSITDRLKIELVGSACNAKAYPITYSEQEFNDLVAQLETNFGDSPTIEEYNKMIKEIDWNNAPEGATHYARESRDEVACWIKRGCNDKLNYITATYHKTKPKGDLDCWMPTEDFNISYLTTRPQPTITAIDDKPVYTQEFRVRGGASPIWQACEILFTGDKYIVVRNENGREFSRRKAKIEIRNIDTRTDKERAIDDLGKLVGDCESDYGILKAIIEGKVHGVTFKPLTVGE